MTSPSEGSPAANARAITVVALVIAVVAGVFVGLGLHKRSRDADAADSATGPGAAAVAAAAKTVLADAGQYAVDLTSFNYLTLNKDQANTAKDLTPAYAKIYYAQSQAAAPLVRKAKAVAVTNVNSVGLSQFDPAGGTATAIVALTATTKNSQTPAGALTYYRFQLTLSRQADGSWLLSGLKPA